MFLAVKNLKPLAAAATLSIALTGCASQSGESASPSSSSGDNVVTLLAYDSFPTKDIAPGFEEATGYKLNVLDGADGAELTNKLVVTKDNPLADVALGMDNNVALTAYQADVFDAPKAEIPAGVEEYNLKDAPNLVPFDHSQYCLNYDAGWFENKGLNAPTQLSDLVKPQYKDLLVVEDPRKSTPGMGFLTATMAANKDGGDQAWVDYWTKLKENGVEVSAGWTEAFAEFTVNEGGTKPIMAGYSSSAAYPSGEDANKNPIFNIRNIDASCYDAVEYMGMLKGAKNPAGAKALIEYLLGSEVQSTVAAVNYMYPVNPKAELPEDLATHAPQVEGTGSLDAKTVADNRTNWLKTWADTMGV